MPKKSSTAAARLSASYEALTHELAALEKEGRVLKNQVRDIIDHKKMASVLQTLEKE